MKRLTTDEVFLKLKDAGIVQNRFVFLKWVREGKLHGKMTSKKKGYRFIEEDVEYFIEHFEEDEEYSMRAELELLQKEKEEWKRQMKMPKANWIKENLDLRQRLQNAEKQIFLLENQLQQTKEDQTIRIRVE